MKETPFACDMSVLDPEMRIKHIDKIKEVFQAAKEIREISNGFAFLFSPDSNNLLNLILFLDRERLCCPFFGFIIEFYGSISKYG